MRNPFDKTNLFINKLVGRTYHNPLGRKAFLAAGNLAQLNVASRVLDVGTGRGYGAVYLAKTFGCSVVGIDISDTMLAESRRLAAKMRGVKFLKASLTDFLSKRSFDLICCFDVLGFVENRKSAIRNMVHLLKEGGILAWSDYFCRRKTDAVRRLISRWNVKSTGPYGSIRDEMVCAGFEIVQYKDTTASYRCHWFSVRRRLMSKKKNIIGIVGKEAFDHYLSAVDTILDATAKGSFGHVSGTARKVWQY